MPEKVKPLTEVMVIGKTKRGGEPFPISGQRGLYFFIPVEEFDWLRKVNDAYKTLYREGVKPLERIKVVGRGGIEGYRPFLLKGHYGRYLCILAEHLHQLEDINRAYAVLLEAEALEEERRKIEEARRVEVEKPPEGKYVYCVIPAQKEKLSFGNIGIGGSGEVYTINYGPIAAVVSDAPVKEYVLTEDNVRVHNQVLSRVMENHTVVPMAFGQVFKNGKILGAVLEKMRAHIKKAFEVVEGKVELGVKVILPKGPAFYAYVEGRSVPSEEVIPKIVSLALALDRDEAVKIVREDLKDLTEFVDQILGFASASISTVDQILSAILGPTKKKPRRE